VRSQRIVHELKSNHVEWGTYADGSLFGALAVAEGIENAADLQAVAAMGCDLGQGYLLGHPTPKVNFLALLREHALEQETS
jgi:EAL domain-containing protein (putative c-di-GMP-specific phosphodiesterase class I)